MKRIFQKSSLVLLSIILFQFSIQATVINSTSGSIVITESQYGNNMYEEWTIDAGQSYPLLISYEVDLESCDYVSIYGIDNWGELQPIQSLTGTATGVFSTQLPTGKALIIFSTDDAASGVDDGYGGFTINFTLDNSQSNGQITSQLYVNENAFINGNSSLMGNVGVGAISEAGKSFKLYNYQKNQYGLYSYSYKTGSANTYGIYSRATNGSGNVYGLYSSVTGASGKWAGYFSGGDVEINNGALKTNGNVLMSTGKLGIGTSNPVERLQIGSFQNTLNAKLSIPGLYNFEEIKLGQYGNGSCGLEFINHVGVASSYGVRLYSNIDSGTSGLQVQTAAPANSYGDLEYVTQLLVHTSGNVGIGTTSPTARLDVNGNSKAIQYESSDNISSIGTFLSDLFVYSEKPLGHYSLGWYDDGWTSGGPSLWVSGYGGMKFFTNGTPRLAVTIGGNVGIGTTAPIEMLTVNGNMQVGLNSGSETGYGNKLILSGINDTGGDPTWLARYNSASNNTEMRFNLGDDEFGDKFAIGYTYHADQQWKEIFSVNTNGNVGIGTTTPQNKLEVNGIIRAKEVKIEVANWPDFVFDKGYRLPALSEVENHIEQTKHLPGVPSETEALENGIELAKMQAILLQKIEELTLYTIQQSKENQAQKKLIEELQKRLEVLEKK